IFHGDDLSVSTPRLSSSAASFPGGILANQDDLLVDTKHGRVQGKLLSVLGGDVGAFLGIPYGKPPVGKLRFRAPEPVDTWEGVKDASNLPNACYQSPDTSFPGFEGSEMWNPNTPVSEDCLYLNVWSPRFNTTQSKPSPLAPVLVWIYGGGFISGTSSLDIYNGRFLTKSEGVVVVSMNYRLGAFGFLSIPDNKNIQSNVGLLDQRLALNWVANNIAAFGGDSSQVTLFGESAGSASVGLHLLSPGSQSLFHRAVMQSGSPNAPWATISKEETWRRSMKLVTLLGCPTSPPADMEACMQKADPQQISLNQFNVLGQPSFFEAPFAPHVDGDFLPDKVEVLLSTGKLPKKEVLFGLNKDEGTYFLVYGLPGFNVPEFAHSYSNRGEFMKHWANFARVGNPGLDGASWPVFTPEKQEYVTLNYNHPEQRNMMSARECHLWKKLIPRVQGVSDELLACVKGNGIILHCNYAFLLILLVITLTY
ncbi:hypothetical protein KUCAC02_005740, partial [Chaenocephalus aceratus]